MIEEPNFLKETQYDQKSFIQFRLHDLFSKIDILNLESANININEQPRYQGAVFKNLSSAFLTIFSKLTPDEKNEGKKMRKEIVQLFSDKPIVKKVQVYSGKFQTMNCPTYLDETIEALFEFRLLIEEFMDKHGFNPSKENLGRVIAKQ